MKRIISWLLMSLLLVGALACHNPVVPNDKEDVPVKETATDAPVVTDEPQEDEPQEDEPLKAWVNPNVAALSGPTGVGLAYLMQEKSDFYNVSLYTAPDQITAKFINGEIDIAAVPVNLASVLYNKTQGEAAVIAVNTLGVLYLLENGETVSSMQDLSGKTVWSTGQGSTPQYILEHLLAVNGLTDSVKVEYLADNTELIAKLVSGEAELAVLPEPHVSVARAQSETLRVALSLTDAWGEQHDTDLVQGVYLVRRAYLEENAAFVDAFLTDAAASAEQVLTAEDAASVVVAAGILPNEGIAKRAIPNCNIVLKTDAEMKALVQDMLTVLFEANPASVGGALPDDGFYYVPSAS